jgi:hypothetical protein
MRHGCGMGSQRTLDAEFFFNLLSTSKSLFVAVVPNSDIGAGFCKPARNGEANASARTAYDGCLAFQ